MDWVKLSFTVFDEVDFVATVCAIFVFSFKATFFAFGRDIIANSLRMFSRNNQVLSSMSYEQMASPLFHKQVPTVPVLF